MGEVKFTTRPAQSARRGGGVVSVYRVYLAGLEFGIDYLSLKEARTAKNAYAAHHPHCRYYIRRVK